MDRLYIVAGNHDVDRDVDGRHDVIRKVFYDSERYYHPDNGIIEPEDLSVIMTGEKNFLSFRCIIIFSLIINNLHLKR